MYKSMKSLWILVSLTGKIYDGWIRYLEFNHYYTKNRLMSWSNDKEIYHQKRMSYVKILSKK